MGDGGRTAERGAAAVPRPGLAVRAGGIVLGLTLVTGVGVVIAVEGGILSARAATAVLIGAATVGAMLAGWMADRVLARRAMTDRTASRNIEHEPAVGAERIRPGAPMAQDGTAPAPSAARMATLERELTESRARLRDALAVQERFISNVSHELKTPISVVLTEAQTIQAAELPAEGQRFVQSVTDEMRRLSRMIQSFLTLARLRGGRTLEHSRTCVVNEFVMEAIAGCTPLARRAGVMLVPELSESDGPIAVHGELDLLQTLVDNLIRNAIRFSPAGLAVQVRVSSDGGDCVVTVRDSGPGCPEDMLDKVSHRFVHPPMAGLPGRANGLGLSIAQGIAELHGGRITVANSPEGGCEFAVRLPMPAVAAS